MRMARVVVQPQQVQAPIALEVAPDGVDPGGQGRGSEQASARLSFSPRRRLEAHPLVHVGQRQVAADRGEMHHGI